jgi:DNA-binding MarR family transcriptional regulator
VQGTELDAVTDAVLRASRALVAISARSVLGAGEDVTLAQYRALVVLRNRGPQTAQELSTELHVVPSTGTRMCDRLVRKGLVDRQPSSADRREVELTITRAGRALVDGVMRRRRTELRRIVGQLRPRQRDALVTALDAFSDAAGEADTGDWYLGWT